MHSKHREGKIKLIRRVESQFLNQQNIDPSKR